MPYKAAQGDHQVIKLHTLSSNHLAAGTRGKADLLFRAQEEDVRKSGFHTIAYAAGAIRTLHGFAGIPRVSQLLIFPLHFKSLADIAHMRGINDQGARE